MRIPSLKAAIPVKVLVDRQFYDSLKSLKVQRKTSFGVSGERWGSTTQFAYQRQTGVPQAELHGSAHDIWS